MKQTYKAMQVSRLVNWNVWKKNFRFPAREVLIKVEACGICGADSGVVEGLEKSVEYPRVPGHEVVGTICKTSGPLPAWLKPGQRVGVGRLGGHCNACEQCRLGHFNLCQNQPVTGSTRDGVMQNTCWRVRRGWSQYRMICPPLTPHPYFAPE